ncbi:hypothetical protein AVEN_164306-1 [Araneus ventricosus]|uniref:Uncharacterized protein n=1 Tax=Araneus ventricosus TaxID=182803 RepID=A0A4Y2VCP5_ARAVE|nr:hypothetical protein AVEN_141213-1 [Araneus ventricosus]GBO22308.1 hypothetical protein AVEN_164306-1 [Araneus ventricosus]
MFKVWYATPESGISITVLESKMPDEYISKSTVEFRRLENPCPRPILPRNFKILKSSSKWHATFILEQLTVKYHIQISEFSAQQQLLFIGTSSCSAPATIPQNPDGLPPTYPLTPTIAADHLIPRTEITQHHQRTITGDHGHQKLLPSFLVVMVGVAFPFADDGSYVCLRGLCMSRS